MLLRNKIPSRAPHDISELDAVGPDDMHLCSSSMLTHTKTKTAQKYSNIAFHSISTWNGPSVGRESRRDAAATEHAKV